METAKNKKKNKINDWQVFATRTANLAYKFVFVNMS